MSLAHRRPRGCDTNGGGRDLEHGSRVRARYEARSLLHHAGRRRAEHRPVTPHRPQDSREPSRHRDHGPPAAAPGRDRQAPRAQTRGLALGAAQDAPGGLHEQLLDPRLRRADHPPPPLLLARALLVGDEPGILRHLTRAAEPVRVVERRHKRDRRPSCGHADPRPRPSRSRSEFAFLLGQIDGTIVHGWPPFAPQERVFTNCGA